MLRLNCPYCGLRDQSEFKFGGESAIVRPGNPDQVTDAEWAEYMFYRKNIKGVHFERWVHTFGCRQWFQAVRNTVTHEITETFRMDESPKTSSPGQERAKR